ncbi:hypothetical protein L1049_011837 [Liquidambar formosana]|uniref:Sulfotransferase n=1 Tax=Liquidambar formosana TaxID=63359 RepID=A0AAP0RSN5_LIQFO
MWVDTPQMNLIGLLVAQLLTENVCDISCTSFFMASTQPFRGQTREGDEAAVNKEVQDLLFTLPKEKGWTAQYIYNYQGVWNEAIQTQNRVSIQKHFKACDTDLILISFPKSGTTWLKALMFSIVNRKRYTLADNPLLTVNPHVVVPFIELLLSTNNNQIPNDTSFPLPRLFSTHSPFLSLPESIKASKCRIVYICRNPLDNFISLWHYVVKCRPEHLGPLTIEDALDMFCRGISNWGPFWDHVLGYWKASLENPQKVLFLKYEDM